MAIAASAPTQMALQATGQAVIAGTAAGSE
jgi:hypothetical protein